MIALGRKSTGRTVAEYLSEKLAMEEIVSNPRIGKVTKTILNDETWGYSEGWRKMTNGSKDPFLEIHYVARFVDGIMVAVDDFKFVR